MMFKKRGETEQLLLSRFIAILIVFCVLIIPVKAQEVATGVNTVIIVNSEDNFDNAIALAISRDLGIPVFYTGSEEISRDVIAELQTGTYSNVKSVVLLGGNSVISTNVKGSLTIAGIVGGFEVVRIGGLTETDTALNAITYFYGPNMLEGVTLIEDTNNDIFSLSAHLSYPIIPVSNDNLNVFEFLNTTQIGYANIISHSENLDLKQKLHDLNIKINKEFYGSNNEVERSLQKSIRSLKDNKIVVVEKDKLPPVILNSILTYYEDEDNDGIDDQSGFGLEEFLTLNYKENDNYGIESVYFYSDDQRRLGKIESALLKIGIPFEAISYETSDDFVQNSIELNRDNAREINENFVERDNEMKEDFEINKEEFEKQIAPLTEQIKVFYSLQEDNLPLQASVAVKGILDTSNDVSTRWKLAHAFANEYMN